YQLSRRRDPGPIAGQVSLRRRTQTPRSELYDFQPAELQLSAAEIREVVAYAIPPLGSRGGCAGLRGRGETGHAPGHLRGGDEGNRLQARRPRRERGNTFRRRDV